MSRAIMKVSRDEDLYLVYHTDSEYFERGVDTRAVMRNYGIGEGEVEPADAFGSSSLLLIGVWDSESVVVRDPRTRKDAALHYLLYRRDFSEYARLLLDGRKAEAEALLQAVNSYNIELLDRAIEQIELNPKDPEQGDWRCATGMGLGGWIITLHGDQWAVPADSVVGRDLVVVPKGTVWSIDPQKQAAYQHIKVPEGMAVMKAARRANGLLGLRPGDETPELWYTDNTLEQIRELREMMARGEWPEQAWDQLDWDDDDTQEDADPASIVDSDDENEFLPTVAAERPATVYIAGREHPRSQPTPADPSDFQGTADARIERDGPGKYSIALIDESPGNSTYMETLSFSLPADLAAGAETEQDAYVIEAATDELAENGYVPITDFRGNGGWFRVGVGITEWGMDRLWDLLYETDPSEDEEPEEEDDEEEDGEEEE